MKQFDVEVRMTVSLGVYTAVYANSLEEARAKAALAFEGDGYNRPNNNPVVCDLDATITSGEFGEFSKFDIGDWFDEGMEVTDVSLHDPSEMDEDKEISIQASHSVAT